MFDREAEATLIGTAMPNGQKKKKGKGFSDTAEDDGIVKKKKED